MGSRFLSSGSSSLTALQDGTFDLNVSTAKIQALPPSLPVKTDALKNLVGSLINLADCSFTPIANPLPGTLSVQNVITAYDTTPVNLNTYIAGTSSAISGLESDTQFISASASPNTTTVNSILNTPTIYTDEIGDQTSQTQFIQLGDDNINVSATSFTANGFEVITNADIQSYLPLVGGTMLGPIDMGFDNITDVKGLELNSNIAPGTAGPDSLIIYTLGDKLRYIDETATNYEVATTATLNDYLSLGGGTMTGSINLNLNNLNNVGNISGSTHSRSANNIVSNAGGSVTGNLPAFTDAIGKIVTDSGVPAASVVLGPASAVSGRVAVFQGTSGKLISDGGTSLADYLRLGGGIMAGAINMNGNVITNCTRVDNQFDLSLGTQDATSVNIGRTGVLTSVLGNFTAVVPCGSWASSATFTPAFTANIVRLINPSLFVAGPALQQFTFGAGGVLTYIGTRTREFMISYNITFLSGANGANMSFFNALNGVAVSSAFRQVVGINGGNDNGEIISVTLTHNITLSTGNTVQLCGSCALTSAVVSFTFLSCSIIGLLN